MKISVIYMAQAMKAVGNSREIFTLDKDCTIDEFIIDHLCKQHTKLKNCILNENSSIRKVIAIFIGNAQVELGTAVRLKDGDEITIMPPIAGG